LILTLFLGGLAGAGAAVTSVQTISFAFSQRDDSSGFEGGGLTFLSARSLGGFGAGAFTKFDPSLGTLTNIFLSLEVNATLSLSVGADGLDENSLDDDPFSIQFQPALTSGGPPDFTPPRDLVRVAIVYLSSGPNIGLVVTSDEATIPNLGVTNGLAADFDFDFDVLDENTVTFGGFSNGDTTLTTGSIDPLAAGFDASDFVGVGTVTNGLTINSLVSLGVGPGSATSDNLDFPFLFADLSLEAGNVTLQYEFTPIPEPSSAALVLLAALGLVARRRVRS